MLVEIAMAASGHVRPDAVEYFLALLIAIKSVGEKRAQEAAALRNSGTDGPLHFIALFDVRNVIANGRHAQSRDRWIFRRIDEVIDAAGLESSREFQTVSI